GADCQLYRYPFDFPGVEIRRAPLWAGRSPSPTGINRWLSWTVGQSYGLRHLDELVGKTDVLHAAETFFTMTYQSFQIKRKTGCRLVVTVSENIPPSGDQHPIRKARKRAVIREADLFIAITPTTRAMLIEEGIDEKRIAIVPNSISTRQFEP